MTGASDELMTTSPSRRILLIGLTIGVAALAGWIAGGLRGRSFEAEDLLAIRSGPVPAQLPSARPSGGYVGSERCAACHAKEFETYRAHPMANSMSEVAIKSDTAGGFRAAGHEFQVEVRDGAMWHVVRRSVPNFDPLYRIEEPIRFSIGSGRRGRSYAVQRGSMLYQSPISWYTSHGWGLSPGYQERERVPAFERRLGDGCVQCHAGRVEGLAGRSDEFTPAVLAEAAIGCERCHGPGREHIERHAQGPSRDSGEHDPIVNPKRLDPAAREAVCYQCHMTGAERVLRFGRSEFDFRPGDRFEEVWLAFVHDSKSSGEAMDAVSQVEQMEGSLCFQRSAGRMGCTSCHDPHGVPAAEKRVAFFRERCVACHDGSSKGGCSLPEPERRGKSPEDSCIACHMPRGAAGDVPHTSQTDHRILRSPGAAESRPSSGMQLFQSFGAEVPADEVERARTLLMARYAQQSNDRILAARAAQGLVELRPRFLSDPALHRMLGAMEDILLRSQDVKLSLEAATRLAPRDFETRKRLGLWLHRDGDYPAAAALLGELHVEGPGDVEVGGRLVHSLGNLRRAPDGVTIAESLLKHFPYDWQLVNWLSQVYRSQGKQDLAESYLERAKLLKPASHDAK